jgi:hydroxylaminobenzene mutase
MTGQVVVPPVARHPSDPEPVRSTKAFAVLVLGAFSVLTGPVVGGLIPAILGLALAREARADLTAGRGYLTGTSQLRVGLVLCWVGLALAVVALVVTVVLVLIAYANGTVAGHDVPNWMD